MADGPESGSDYDVDLKVTEEPGKVLVEQGISTARWHRLELESYCDTPSFDEAAAWQASVPNRRSG